MSAAPDAPPDDAPRTWTPDGRGILRGAPPQWEERARAWNRAIAEARLRPDPPSRPRRAAHPVPGESSSRAKARPAAEERIETLQVYADRGLTTREAAHLIGVKPSQLRKWLQVWPELGGMEIHATLKANEERR